MELVRRTKLRGHQVTKALVSLVRDGQIRKSGGRWKAVSPKTIFNQRPDLPGTGTTHTESRGAEYGQTDSNPETRSQKADWNAFRNLCLYYAECIEFESGSRVQLLRSETNKSFVELKGSIDWIRLARGESVLLPATKEISALITRKRHQASALRFRLAGPIAVQESGKHKQDTFTPILLLTVQAVREQHAIRLTAEDAPRINEAWLEAQFPKSRQDQREDLLIRLGFLLEEDDSEGSYLRPASGVDVQSAWQALFKFKPNEFQEPGGPDRPQHKPPIQDLKRRGYYNRILLTTIEDSTFSAGLLDELRKLSKCTNKQLEQTALAPFFADKYIPTIPTADSAIELIQPEFTPLNREQREAVSLASHVPVLAIQGPPGTGKSTVVTHIMCAHALENRAVLFASRNHRALEAVIPRLQAIDEDRPLVLRLTKGLDNKGAQGDDWLKQMLKLLGNSPSTEATKKLHVLRKELQQALSARGQCEKEILAYIAATDSLGQATSIAAKLSQELSPEWHDRAAQRGASLDPVALAKASKTLTKKHSWIINWIHHWSAKRIISRQLARVSFSIDQARAASPDWDGRYSSLAQILSQVFELSKAMEAIPRLEEKARSLPPQEHLIAELQIADQKVQNLTRKALVALARSLGSGLPPAVRASLTDLKGELGSRNTGNRFHSLPRKLRNALQDFFEQVVDVIPLWACSSLSIRSRIPFSPGAFDLAVIDEASQCDIPSCLPILFRAKRAVIVGDPMQLRHVGRIGQEVEDRLREKHGVAGIEFGRFRHSANSIWEPAFALAQTDRGETRMLKEHWRCHPAIAGYFSKLFYDGELRVRTSDEGDLKNPNSKFRGIEWTNVSGAGQQPIGGSRYHQGQIDAIVSELARIAKAGFDGSVGVVTPFRAHANRIRDAATAVLPAKTLQRWRFTSETADGFQGDERDIILFGLIGGPSREDTPQFYRRDRNRFNVAVSRARALLHIFGDLSWAHCCGEEPLMELVVAWNGWQNRTMQPIRKDLIGPVWEPKLAAALRMKGIPFHQQHPACGYYLDFALFPEGQKINVEVDGETYHRDSTGARKEDDIRRDQILEAAGWKVLRFWVYQLREDMDNCVSQISTAFHSPPAHAQQPK